MLALIVECYGQALPALNVLVCFWHVLLALGLAKHGHDSIFSNLSANKAAFIRVV
jgi:hypothetical protein